MKLTRYNVKNFKSVKDSGWISCSEVTTLVGVNEAGKSNLLLALWKLNPATGGKIDVIHDAPVSQLTEIRKNLASTPFITAYFDLDPNDMKAISTELGYEISDIESIKVTRYYDNHYECELPKGLPSIISSEKDVDEESDENNNSGDEEPTDDSASETVDEKILSETIIKHLPKFVYYSNYGNLSTRLYLPHVNTWLKDGNVAGIARNEDQIRTMRVLFKFVKLEPDEIIELGLDPKEMAAKRNGYNMRYSHEPTVDDIKKAQAAKEERTILLQSAGAKLTSEFSDWWKQGEYKFRFSADGDYLTIWVSDSKRPAEVDLSLRSTGLQWFLSFFLVFLVESKYKHKDAILLLDEAGLTLHPRAQRDLCLFFNELSADNQIIHTTHSPFIVDTNNIDRCKVVYVDKEGYTVASSNLRESDDKLNEQSIYAVHAALGLSVSDILFQGCMPIIVEGASDQIYLSAIKQALISAKKFASKEECIFVPSGGVRGIPGVVSLLGGKQGELPLVIVDSDKSGTDCKTKLLAGLYKDDKKSIIEIGEILSKSIENAEVEDLIPFEFLRKGINKLFNDVDEDEEQFEDVYDENRPIIPQIEDYARAHSVELDKKGWKVELAKSAKARIIKSRDLGDAIGVWEKLFKKFISQKKK